MTDEGFLDATLRKALELALDVDRESARQHIDELRRKHPRDDRKKLTRRLISRARWWSVGSGFATGLPANPWVSLPAAAADLGIVLRLELHLATRIALLFEPDYLDGDDPPYELLVPILGSRVAGEFIRQAAMGGGTGITRESIKGILTKERFNQFKGVALKYLGVRLAKRALISKTVPVVGGLIGGGWNYLELRAVGKRVCDYFENRAVDGD